MKHRTHIGKAHVFVAIAVATVVGLALGPPAEAQNTVALAGAAPAACSMTVNTLGAAATLPITTESAQHIEVATVTSQRCNLTAGYTLTVTSAECSTGTAGAKVYKAAAPADFLGYSVEFTNPTTGGSSADVTGLLATVCTGQIGRDVTGSKINNETSHVYANFTGSSLLEPGSYADTLTITMTTK